MNYNRKSLFFMDNEHKKNQEMIKNSILHTIYGSKPLTHCEFLLLKQTKKTSMIRKKVLHFHTHSIAKKCFCY